ncbi:MAG: nuclear transport factor 2 family protein [Flavobacteriales bacterium]
MRHPLTSLLLLFASALCAQPDERAAVLSVIDHYFATMAARDSAGMQAVLTDEGMFHGKYSDAPNEPARLMSHGPYLARLQRDTMPLLERYWDPVVYIEGPIATVTAPYDFHVGRKLKHCGIDHFTLVKEADGWKISGGVFTMQRSGCPESPLGPAYE